VYCTDAVRDALSSDFPVLRLLASYCGVVCQALATGSTTILPGSSLEVTPFETGNHVPRYARRENAGLATIGLLIHDCDSGGTAVYAPCVSDVDDELVSLFGDADCVLVDGTFWRDDELGALGVGACTARAMGHVPLGGPDGSLVSLANVQARKIIVHVNNTNPVFLVDSSERSELDRAGVELGYDGMDLDVP
jgi:pyrroloquinoline quinone biosynthesis protein B